MTAILSQWMILLYTIHYTIPINEKNWREEPIPPSPVGMERVGLPLYYYKMLHPAGVNIAAIKKRER
jgi:hypothetical protein